MAEPTKRRALGYQAVIGSKRFVINESDATLYEFKKSSDTEPSKAIEVSFFFNFFSIIILNFLIFEIKELLIVLCFILLNKKKQI